MTRRFILGLFLASLLGGCGFQLRGSSQFSGELQQLFVEGMSSGTPFMQKLTEILQRSGGDLAKDRHSASAVLRILDNDEDTRVLSVSRAGRSNEFDLTYKIAYELTNPKGEIILPRQEIRINREYYNDQFLAIGKAEEEQRLRQEMHTEAAETVTRRIAWVLAHQGK